MKTAVRCNPIKLIGNVIPRFMNGECNITLTTLEKLAPVLGLRITTTAKKRPSDSGHRTKTVKKAR